MAAPSIELQDSDDIKTQENVSSKNVRQSAKNAVRHRASVACASCRDRRIRCVVPKNHNACTACQRSGSDCIIKNDDERRRPISKAYMSSLSDRIAMLEGMLLDRGVIPPPASHPPKTRHDARSREPEETPMPMQKPQIKADSACEVPSPPDSRIEDFSVGDHDCTDGSMATSGLLQPLAKEESPFRMLDPKQEDIVHRLLSTNGNMSFDQLSGRFRFFGPTANSHVYGESPERSDNQEPPEQLRRAERIIRSMNAETHDYLMTNFWEYYNSVLQIVDRQAFEADREAQNPKFYSSFLHITILAMGYRVADMNRQDMRRIFIGKRESVLHREAKYMLDVELERPGGISSVQALLILGDLECGVGRDNTGWMYSGMANRLAFDLGLHLGCRNLDITEQEGQVRHRAMVACMVYDRYWGLFLGRPLAIKSQDVDVLTNKFSSLNSAFGANPTKDLASEIYEQLMELMELAGRIVETRDGNLSQSPTEHSNPLEAEDNAYLHVINLDRQLQNWYRRLPDHLAWKPSNIKTAPYSFFLLHQQYHVSMILLHRPWAKYGAITSDTSSPTAYPSPGTNDSGMPSSPERSSTAIPAAAEERSVSKDRASLSRSICTQQAIRVARIFWQHRQRFDGRKIFVTGIQHAGTAAIALIAALAYQRNEADRHTYIGYLEILSDAIGDMSHTYQPAQRMDDLLRAVLEQIRSGMGEPPRPRSGSAGFNSISLEASTPNDMNSPLFSDNSLSTVPLRRGAPDEDFGQPSKKRRPGGSRRASEFARPPPPFFSSTPAQLASPKTTKGQILSGNSLNQAPLDSFLFPTGVGETSGHFGMDFLSGTAIDMESGEESTESMNLGLPSVQSWGLDGISSSSHGDSSFDSLSPWSTGPAGLSASSILNPSAAMSSGIMSGTAPFGISKSLADYKFWGLGGSNPLKRRNTMQTSSRQMDWLTCDSNTDAVSPGSLDGFLDSTAKPQRENGINGIQRNRNLDFFSFS